MVYSAPPPCACYLESKLYGFNALSAHAASRQRLLDAADGHVDWPRANDGRLIRRYRAAPADLRMGAFGQIESVWPVHGSVLIRQDEHRREELWCVASRSMFLDHGLRLLRLNPSTGAKLAEQKLDAMPVFDGLIAAGDRIYYATTDGRIIALGE